MIGYQFILASSSPQRLMLLKTIGLVPDQIISPNINEDRLKKEKPNDYVTRLAKEKAVEVSNNIKDNAFILAADTIVGTNARLFDKAVTTEDVEKNLKFFSGRRIYIKTSISVIKLKDGIIVDQSSKLSVSKVKFKRITDQEIKLYIDNGQGIGSAGGLNIENLGQILIKNIEGSYSGIMGLPLYETVNLLKGLGYEYFKSAC
ncbi:MAG: nucleoside triphosphate pyrophosphatase [Pseudomonadota bacterium]